MRNKTDELRTANKKPKTVPKKRSIDPKPDPDDQFALTLAVTKRCKSISSKKTTPASAAVDDSLLSRKTKKFIGRFFYENGLELDVLKSPAFHRMISHFSEKTNHEIEIPTCQELRGWILDDAMGDIVKHVERIRDSWAKTGCTVLLDGWTDKMGRELVNVLVESPKGAVYLRSYNISDYITNVDAMSLFLDLIVEEVGPANVVQLMTYSVSPCMKEVGRRFMERHRSIFWTTSFSRCIELILEKMKSLGTVRETLDRMRTLTGFIDGYPSALKQIGNLSEPLRASCMQPFTILENLVLRRNKLKSMFLSPDSDFNSMESGKRAAGVVGDPSFWGGATATLQAAMPLVRAVDWMNKNRKEQIGQVYETIDQVKETIKTRFNNKEAEYRQFWDVIDEVWSTFLYSPLHAGGYFLNPNFFYSDEVFVDPEVATGLVCCVVRAAEDTRVQDRITIQIEKYRIGAGGFQLGCADGKFNVSSVNWWTKYGKECPELQKVAVRMLGQTCDGASKFRLKRSLAESLFTMDSSRDLKNMANMVFLQYNMHLKNLGSGKITYIAPTYDEMNAMDDVGGHDNMAARVALDGGSTTDRVGNSTDVSCCLVPKKEDMSS